VLRFLIVARLIFEDEDDDEHEDENPRKKVRFPTIAAPKSEDPSVNFFVISVGSC
jgi:hypothetical protein